MSPRASVIVRCRDEEGTIERALVSLRRQTVEPEVIVVDSGSRDRSVEIARRYCDRLIEIPAETFTFGRALNIGAAAASAPYHCALSAHCRLERDDWIERSLSHYERDDVAGVCGYHPDSSDASPRGVFHQDAGHARAHPFWGFSNHASSWRASVWEEHPFDEVLEAVEDKEWALRATAAGWVIAFDPDLYVEGSHAWRDPRENFRRQRMCARAIVQFADAPPYGLRDGLREWWSDLPNDDYSPWRHRLYPSRLAGIAGKYLGHRDGAGRG
jgi:rhamnosyltransferase